jgi:two-component system nitrogen regulation sensor histidine kinase NtrY
MASDLQFLLKVLSCALPATVTLAWLWAEHPFAQPAKVAITVITLSWIAIVAGNVRYEFLRHVRTLTNLVEAIRRQDYSVKGVHARHRGELEDLYRDMNRLIDELKTSRQGEQELLSLLETVFGQINVAIIVCDAHERIRLANRLAGWLFRVPAQDLVGIKFADTPLADLQLSTEPQLVDFRFPGAEGRWQIRQHSYRHMGQASRMVFIADLKQVLAEEEIAAWQRLIRVISHEVNNSLTPITSLCQTLRKLLDSGGPESGSDLRSGLSVIGERAKGLQEFISVYARLARLPEPRKTLFEAASLATRLQGIFAGRPLEILPFPKIAVFGDPVHLEQALINLIKNALEANPTTAPPVRLACQMRDGRCEFSVTDNGPGIANPDNLFVPFYTTKPDGAGIGLVLCRQIAAKHHGVVRLQNRTDGPGAVAAFTLDVYSAIPEGLESGRTPG